MDELPSSAAASAAPNSLAAKKSRERFAINKSYSIEVREIAQGSLPLVDLHISGSRPHIDRNFCYIVRTEVEVWECFLSAVLGWKSLL